MYVAHGGGPLPLLGAASQAPITAHLKAVPRTVPKPKAIITVSAHWEVGTTQSTKLMLLGVVVLTWWGLTANPRGQRMTLAVEVALVPVLVWPWFSRWPVPSVSLSHKTFHIESDCGYYSKRT